jgi:hypothetical protein
LTWVQTAPRHEFKRPLLNKNIIKEKIMTEEQNVVSMGAVPTETEENAVAPLKSTNITQVSNGFIIEASRSSLPGEEDPQVRASVHKDIDEVSAHLNKFFAAE